MLTIQRYDPYLTPVEDREDWEGIEPDACIEELQLRQGPISDDEMIAAGYEEVAR